MAYLKILKLLIQSQIATLEKNTAILLAPVEAYQSPFASFEASQNNTDLAKAVKKEHSWWKVLSKENRNLGQFTDSAKAYLAKETRKQVINDLLSTTNLLGTAIKLKHSLSVTKFLVNSLSHKDVFYTAKAVLNQYLEIQNKIKQNKVLDPKLEAASFQKSLENLVNVVKPITLNLGYQSTKWHFEERAALNNPLPSYEEVNSESSDWVKLSPFESKYHDNGVGSKEEKYIHPDGREVVFEGDTKKLITNSEYVGTYNYVVPMPKNEVSIYNLNEYLNRGLGHMALDVLPYKTLGGNAR